MVLDLATVVAQAVETARPFLDKHHHHLTTTIEPDPPLVEGDLDQEDCTIECPRHGSKFDLKTGQPKTLPAYVPVDTFPVIIEEEQIKLEVS